MTTKCLKCGSNRIIPDVHILDQGQYSNGKLQVFVAAEPDALLFKEKVHSTVRAHICGDCGHMELSVDNPEALYRAYRQSQA